MKIKYIIDSPYGGKFTLTDTRDGNYNDNLFVDTAQDLFDNNADECYFSHRAAVNLRAVSCEKVEELPSQRHDK